MKKFSRLGQALSIIALFGAMWLVYTILVFSFKEAKNNNAAYIPNNSSIVYQLDGRLLTQELLASLLISEDKELQELVQNKIPTTGEGTLKPVGITFDSYVFLFRLEENGNRYSGMLFNLWDNRVFDKNIPKYLGKNSANASTNDVGLILTQLEGNLSKKALLQRAKQMLSAPTGYFRNVRPQDGKSLISVKYRKNGVAISDVGVSVEGNQLLFKGAFFTKEELSHTNLAQYKGGFHIHSQWLPKELNTALQDALKTVGIELPALKQFSLNYFGATIVTEPSIAGLPHMAGSFEFEEPVVTDSIFKDFTLISSDSVTNEKVYDVLSMQYAIRQVNATTIDIRSAEGVDLTEAPYSSTAEISGSPKQLLKLDGDKFIRGILTLTNEFKSLSSFVNEVEKMDIKMTPTSNKNYRIEGKIELKNNKWPLNEVLKFLIQSNLL